MSDALSFLRPKTKMLQRHRLQVETLQTPDNLHVHITDFLHIMRLVAAQLSSHEIKSSVQLFPALLSRIERTVY